MVMALKIIVTDNDNDDNNNLNHIGHLLRTSDRATSILLQLNIVLSSVGEE